MPPSNTRKKRNKRKNKSSPSPSPSSSSPLLPLPVLFSRVDALRDQLRFDDCVQLLTAQLAHRTQDKQEQSMLMDLLGEVFLDSGDAPSAQNIFQHSVDLLPHDGFSKYMNLGQISASHGSPEDAVQHYKKGVQIMRQTKHKVVQGGQAAEQQMGITAAELNVLIGNGCCSIADLFMTDLCFDPNAEQECEDALRIALQEEGCTLESAASGGSNMQVLQTLASVRLSQNREEEARSCMQRVMHMYSQQQQQQQLSYDFQIGTAKILMELGEFSSAEELLVEAGKQYDDVADLWYLMGVACQHQKRYTAAIRHFRHAISLAESHEDDPRYVDEIKREMHSAMEMKKQQSPEEAAAVGDDDDEDEEEYAIDGAAAAAAILGAAGMGELPDSDAEDEIDDDDDQWEDMSSSDEEMDES